MAIRKTWHLGFNRAKSHLRREISPHNSEEGATGDAPVAESSSSLGHEETPAEIDNFLGDFEEIHPGKIILNPQTRPFEQWAVKISGQSDEWRHWDLDKLLLNLGLPKRELIRKVLDFDTALSEMSDIDRLWIDTWRRVVYDGLTRWNHLKEDAEKALSEYLGVHGPEDFAALPEKRLQKHERDELWDLCSASSKEVLRETWGRLPNGRFQNYGWRGVLRSVATLDAKVLDLGKAGDVRWK